MPQATLLLTFVLALQLPNGMSTNEPAVVSCCSMGNYSNIDDILKHAQSVNGTTICIQPGNYTLSGSYQFHSKSEISIIGSGEDSTIVNCERMDSGIAFVNSYQIEIHNLSIVGCGAINNPDRDIYNCTQYFPLQVALYFKLCKHVTVAGISILHSNGTGLAFLDTVGRVEIINSNISSSKTDDTPGGGGLYIEFTSDVVDHKSSGAHGTRKPATETSLSVPVYQLSSCKFFENQATPGDIKTTHIAHHCNNFPLPGRGGGMTVYFNGNASGNNISVSRCMFSRNSAELGGGLFVSFLGSSNNNKVEIISSTFESNNCSREPSLVSRYSSGAGAKINFNSKLRDNQAIISNTHFTKNSAHWGGGLSLYSDTVSQGEIAWDRVEISGCHFEGNIARIGAAVDMLCQTFDSVTFQECPLTPVIINCDFVNNGGIYTYQDGTWGITDAAVNLDHLPAIFRDNVTFYKSKGSALAVRETVVQVMPSAFLNFTRNTGRNGGAIAFMGKSWVVLHEETKVIFDSNAAVERGGAIYATQLLNCYMVYSYSCFVRYFKPGVHPDEWIAALYFKNNTEFAQCPAKHSNSIYASSIFPCVWPSSPDSDIKSDINATFCDWNSWEFDTEGNCTADITTSAGSFGMNEYNMTGHAGVPQPLGVQVYDDLHQQVTNRTLFTVSSELDTQLQSIEITNNILTSSNELIVHGTPNTSSSISLQTSDSRAVYATINTELLPCPPGYELENSTMTCICQGRPFAGYVHCTQHFESSIFVGYCISYSKIEIKGKPSKQVIVASCPFFSGFQVSGPSIPLPMNVNKLDETFCTEQWNRTGKLCDKCLNNKGISVFSSSYNCTECTNLSKNWLIYITVTFLPLTLFFLIVVIFHVGVISPQTNGYIFFSQIITIPLHKLKMESAWALALKDNTAAQHALSYLLLFPYSVWSLDFFYIFYAGDICLHKSMRIIHVLALQYIPALYPLFLVIISYILIELHARNCRLVVWLWKPFCFLCVRFRRNWEAKTSIIDAFATFLLLSYTKILLVSFSLLTPANILIINGTSVGKILNFDPSVEFFQGDHLPFAILALIILLTIGAFPPLLLLLYPSHTFQRFLSFFKLQSHGLQTFVDAFQGCYKNGADRGPERRYFAGIYFVFRIIVFLIFTVVDSIQKRYTILQATFIIFIVVFVIVRPYKKDRYNILDVAFLLVLAITSTTAVYLYIHLFMYKYFLNGLWYFTYVLLHIPTLYMKGYIIYWFSTHSRYIQTHCISKLNRRNQADSSSGDYTLMDQASIPTSFSLHASDIPDRLQNPHHYEDLSYEVHKNELYTQHKATLMVP